MSFFNRIKELTFVFPLFFCSTDLVSSPVIVQCQVLFPAASLAAVIGQFPQQSPNRMRVAYDKGLWLVIIKQNYKLITNSWWEWREKSIWNQPQLRAFEYCMYIYCHNSYLRKRFSGLLHCDLNNDQEYVLHFFEGSQIRGEKIVDRVFYITRSLPADIFLRMEKSLALPNICPYLPVI